MRILVLDDDAFFRAALHRILLADGHTVFEAGNALEAINVINNETIDVGLIDYELRTTMTGVDVAKHAKRGTALVMLTGYDPATMRPIIEDPLKPFLSVLGKPVDRNELRITLAHAAKTLGITRP